MPYKTERMKLPEGYDRRVKLTDKEKEEIIELSYTTAKRKLARMYKVSRRLIDFIINPEKHQKNQDRRNKDGGWRRYYDKDKHNESTRRHRKYKYTVIMGEYDGNVE